MFERKENTNIDSFVQIVRQTRIKDHKNKRVLQSEQCTKIKIKTRSYYYAWRFMWL